MAKLEKRGIHEVERRKGYRDGMEEGERQGGCRFGVVGEGRMINLGHVGENGVSRRLGQDGAEQGRAGQRHRE